MEEIKKSGKTESENFNDDGMDELLPAVMTHLTPALIEVARTELNETEETKRKALVELRKLLEAEKNLVCPTDDFFMIPFLRARKFDVKKAFKLVRSFFTYLKDYKKIFDIRDPQVVISVLERDYIGVLSHRDKDGCLVVIFKVGMWDPYIDTVEDVIRAFSGYLLYTLEHEATHIAGYRFILDIRGISFKHMKQLTPSVLSLFFRGTQDCFPARHKGFHILSDSVAIRVVWALIFPILTAKLRKRVHLHGEDLSPLLDYIHPSVLPEEFGGRAPTYSNDDWTDLILDRVPKQMDFLDFGYKN